METRHITQPSYTEASQAMTRRMGEIIGVAILAASVTVGLWYLRPLLKFILTLTGDLS